MRLEGNNMKVAVIGDIHGNKYALDSVLNDIKKRNIDIIVCTGDLVGYMPFPKEVIQMIREHKILVIKGNHDERIAQLERVTDDKFAKMATEEVQKSASAIYVNRLLSDEEIGYLNALPEQLTLKFESNKVLFVHGSPNSISEYMYDDSELLRKIGSTVDVQVIVSGHTHLPYHTEVDGIQYLNPGSIGKPKHGNKNSKYLILEITEEVRSQFIEVEYDVNAMVEAINANPYIADGIATSLIEGK